MFSPMCRESPFNNDIWPAVIVSKFIVPIRYFQTLSASGDVLCSADFQGTLKWWKLLPDAQAGLKIEALSETQFERNVLKVRLLGVAR